MKTSVSMTALGELMVSQQESVDPSAYLSEVFELFSIPAYDSRKPDIVEGSAIGSAKKVVNPDDVLLSRIVPHIRRAWVVPNASGRRQIASSEWIVFRSPKFQPSYLRHLLMSDVFHAKFMNTVAGVGGSLLRARPAFVAQIQIPLPPLPEQKRIADILDRADAIRRKRHGFITEAHDFLTSLFLKTFGSPQHNPHSFRELPFGDVVENCDSRRVPLKQSDRDKRDGIYPYYGSVGIIDYLDDYLFDGDYLLISEDGKHLESRNRPIACLALGKFWVNNHAHVLAANGTVLLPYLARYMELKHIREFVTGIDQFKLNRGSLDRIPVAVPPMDRQLSFVAKEKHVLQMIGRSEVALKTAEDLFNSLVQRAFKGEL